MSVRATALTLAATAMLAGCKQDRIDVKKETAGDYNHAALLGAVDQFVAKGRTTAAYAALSQRVLELRPGMDRSVAEEAELKLVVLALAPMNANVAKSTDQQVDALALTVWPTLLAPRLEADTNVIKRDAAAADYVPKPAEAPHDYLLRLCGSILAGECKHVVPELQGGVVGAIAIRRATERVRNSVSACLTCSTESGWHAAVLSWEDLDRAAASKLDEIQREANPDNWPVSGAAAEADPVLPEAEINGRGELVVGGHLYGPNQQRIDVFKDLVGTGDAIELHVRPDTTLAQLKGFLLDAKKANIKRVAIIAREATYPWRRRAYWVSAETGMRPNLRPSDVVQLLIHAVDEVSGPGTVARVE